MLETNLLETPYGPATVLFLDKLARNSTTVLLDSCGEFTIGGTKMVIALTAINHGTGFESAGLSIGQFDETGRNRPLDVDDAVRRGIREALVDALNEWVATDGYAEACREVEREAGTDAANGSGEPCFG